eukprot:5099472-Pleurochrysis_carterae.AAC.1
MSSALLATSVPLCGVDSASEALAPAATVAHAAPVGVESSPDASSSETESVCSHSSLAAPAPSESALLPLITDADSD